MPDHSPAMQSQSSFELRRRAAWYRSFAERAGSPVIWEKRLLTAERLEAEAERIDEVPGAARRRCQEEST